MKARSWTIAGLSAVAVAAVSPLEANAAVNYALDTYGASFVSASSAIGVGDLTVMQNDVVAASKTPWYPDGDTRYIFGANDPSASIEISLGQVREITDIGASIDLPSQGDRPVNGPFSVEVSLNGTTWTSWGTAVSVLPASTNPISIAGAPTAVKYIDYNFGSSGSYYGGFGGSAVDSVFASGVPETSTWAMMVLGLAGLALLACRNRAQALNPATT
jgi:hypothetical protein